MRRRPVGCSECLFRDIDGFSLGQYLAILRCEEVCFFFREKVIIIFTKHLFLREANNFFCCLVPAYKTQFFCILHEEHIRHTLDDRVKEGLCLFELQRALLCLLKQPQVFDVVAQLCRHSRYNFCGFLARFRFR